MHTTIRDAITLLAGEGHHEMAERLEHVVQGMESAEAPLPDWGARCTDSMDGWLNELATLGAHPNLGQAWIRRAIRAIHEGIYRHAQPAKVEAEPVARLEREYDEDEPELRGDLVVTWLTGKELPEGTKLYTAPTVQPARVEAEPVPLDFSARLREALDEYEWTDGEGTHYTPTEKEKHLIEDFVYGFDWPPRQPARVPEAGQLAKAVFALLHDLPEPEDESQCIQASERDLEISIEEALESLTASPEQGWVKKGWKLVPVEPTKAMIEAFEDAGDNSEYYWNRPNGFTGPSHAEGYRAMLDAAPAPPEEE